jgi:hypothetical protein
MTAVGLDWHPNATKAIIVLGDAPPLDPEPFTGYTLNSVLAALYNSDVAIDIDKSDGRVLGDASDSLIKVFSIGTDASAQAADYFSRISKSTGGAYTGVEHAAEVSDAIIDSIEKIEVVPTKTVNAQFGDAYSSEVVEMYQNGKFAFDFVLDESGNKKLENMELDRFTWSIPRLQESGTIKINDNGKSAKINFDDTVWYSFAIRLWHRDRVSLIGFSALVIIVVIALFVIIGGILQCYQTIVSQNC